MNSKSTHNQQQVFYEYHKTRTVLDVQFLLSVFERDERESLSRMQGRYPHSIIRSPHADLVAAGISGIGGSVPASWDGSIRDWDRGL